MPGCVVTRTTCRRHCQLVKRKRGLRWRPRRSGRAGIRVSSASARNGDLAANLARRVLCRVHVDVPHVCLEHGHEIG